MAKTYDITIIQNQSLVQVFSVSGYDITGATAKMQIRSQDGTLIDELTTENGKLQVVTSGTYPTGTQQVKIVLTKTQTATYDICHATYDLFVTKPDTTNLKLVKGKVIFEKSVTAL